jgi:sugar phosphate isomerase/epimerase
MQLLLFKTMWGNVLPIGEAAARAAAAGYDGLEAPAIGSAAARHELGYALQNNDLRYIAEICTAGSYVPCREASVKEHLESLRASLDDALELAPLFVTVMAGCDAWSIEQSVEFFGAAHELASTRGATASFETHRGRSFFNPWTTRDVLRQLPQLKITCDFSHWCVVCERLIDSETDVLELCFERAHHIHARIGHAQGAQAADPSAPEYADALAAHERWWNGVWQSQKAREYSRATMTPECGPDGYMPLLPHTRQPVADVEAVNSWMMRRQRARFEEVFAA